MAATDLKELFGNLTIETDDEPMPAPQRGGRDELPNPFAPALQESLDSDTSKTIWIPADAVPRAVFLLNAAALKMNRGVRIVPNLVRNEKGQIVKGANNKVQYIVETRGAHKGLVRVRFQTKEERKKTAPRPFSIINDPQNEGGKALRDRATGEIVARGTHDEMRAENKRRKTAVTANATANAAAE